MWQLHLTHPAFLYLAGGAVVPLIVHVLRRRRIQQVHLPTVRFLEASASKRKLVKTSLRQMLLLVMRMALVALLALALARPFLAAGDTGRVPVAGEHRVWELTAVLILDDSLSMNYRRGGESRFQSARNQAMEVVERLPLRAEAALMVTSQPTATFCRDAAELRGRLSAASATLGSNSCVPALRRGAQALRDRPSEAGVIYLFTDMTRGAWRELESHPSGQESSPALKLGEQVALEVVDVGARGGSNAAVSGLAHTGGPLLQGGKLELAAELLCVGDESEQAVQFELDGQLLGRRRVRLPRSGKRRVSFSASVQEPGHHWGRMELMEPDALVQDNTRTFAFEAAEDISVLCVEERAGPRGESASPAEPGRSYFFRSALSPWGGEGQGFFRVSTAARGELDARSLARSDLVALIGSPAPAEGTWRRLADFVAGGGALLVSFGPGSGVEGYRTEAARELLPATPGEVLSGAEPDEPMQVRVVGLRHPLVQALREAGAEVDRAQFRHARRLTPNEGAEELFSFGQGAPALVLGGAGGRVAVFASTLGTEWSDFPTRPEFVPFCQELALHLSGARGGRLRDYQVGEHVPIRFSPSSWPTRVTVFPPGAEDGLRVMPGATPGRRLFWKTGVPGYYRVGFSQQDRQWQSGFAVNTDPLESDLRGLSPDWLRPRIQASRVGFHGDGSTVPVPGREGASGARGPGELTPYVVGLALLVWVAEGLLANRMYRSGSDLGPPGSPQQGSS